MTTSAAAVSTTASAPSTTAPVVPATTGPPDDAGGGQAGTDGDRPDDEAVYGEIGADGRDPASITLTLEEEAAVTGDIGPEGGEVAATSGAGVTFTLTVPSGALLSSTPITLTPVATATGFAIGDAPVALVHLAPEGLTFLAPATLTIRGADDSDPVGIGAGGSGEDVHLLSAVVGAGDAVTVETMHFSVVGVSVMAQIEDLVSDYRPSGREQIARTAVALAGTDHDRAFAALEVWARLLRTDLEGTASTSGLEDRTAELLSLLQAVSEHTRWMRSDQPNALPPAGLMEVVQGIIDLWFIKVTADVERLAAFCTDGPASAFWIYRWVAIGTALTRLLTLDREAELRAWQRIAESCLVFDVRWDTTVTLVDSEASTTAKGTTTVRADEAPDEALRTTSPEFLYIPAVLGSDSWVLTSLAFEGCTPLYDPGTASVILLSQIAMPNPGNAQTAEIERFDVVIGPSTAPEVRCKEDADRGVVVRWGTWFYSSPIGLVNTVRAKPLLDGAWVFSVEVTSPNGVMGSTTVTESRTESGTTGTVEQTVTVTHVPPG